MNLNGPRRRFALKLDLHADTLEELNRALSEVRHKIAEGVFKSCMGGYEAGYDYYVIDTPEMTHDRYVEELEAHLAELNA